MAETNYSEQLKDIKTEIITLNDTVFDMHTWLVNRDATSSKDTAKGAEAESSAPTAEQVDELIEVTEQVRDCVDTGNKINAINGLFIGIVIGLLFIKILVDNIRDN